MSDSEIKNKDDCKRQSTSIEALNTNNQPDLLPNAEEENTEAEISLGQNEIEQKIYQNVLEKLDLKENTQALQEKSMQQEHQAQGNVLNPELKTIVENDFQKIDLMMRLGLVNPLQGQNLKNNVLKKAFDMSIQKDFYAKDSNVAEKTTNKDEIFDEFSKNNPNFFDSDGRKDVLNYLKSEDVLLRKEDLSKISKMIEIIETSAIDRYLKKQAHEKILNNSNEAAKQKLRANAQNTSFSNKSVSRIFTREQIGKMSSAEFSKYEPFIMAQLKKGLIK